MNIIETFLLGKENNPDTCEDGLFISDYLIAVIDGVTAKGTHLWNGKKSGCFAKDILLDTLKNITADSNNRIFLEQEDSAVWILKKLDSALHQKSMELYPNALPLEEYPRASIIFYNDLRKEIVSYGDCQCKINGQLFSHLKKIDILNSELRAYHLEYAILHGKTIDDLKRNDVGRTAILENLKMQFSFENKIGTFAYPVLNGFGIEPHLLKIYQIQRQDTIILASDGYSELGDSLEESESLLKEILSEDPLCFRRNCSTKGLKEGNISFDDRVFCKIQV